MQSCVSDGVVTVLIETLRCDPSPQVRAEAALTLTSLPLRTNDVVDALLGALRDENDLPRRAAALALHDHVDQDIAKKLAQLLRDAPELWREVGVALSGAGAGAIEPELTDILVNAQDVRSRRGAARALRCDGETREAPVGNDGGTSEELVFGYEDAAGVRHLLY